MSEFNVATGSKNFHLIKLHTQGDQLPVGFIAQLVWIPFNKSEFFQAFFL